MQQDAFCAESMPYVLHLCTVLEVFPPSLRCRRIPPPISWPRTMCGVPTRPSSPCYSSLSRFLFFKQKTPTNPLGSGCDVVPNHLESRLKTMIPGEVMPWHGYMHAFKIWNPDILLQSLVTWRLLRGSAETPPGNQFC